MVSLAESEPHMAWINFEDIKRAYALSPSAPAKPDYWWRKDYTSLRRNMNNDDLVDAFDRICGEVIDPRRYTEQEIEDQLKVWDKLAA